MTTTNNSTARTVYSVDRTSIYRCTTTNNSTARTVYLIDQTYIHGIQQGIGGTCPVKSDFFLSTQNNSALRTVYSVDQT